MFSVYKKIFALLGFLSIAVFAAACGTEASKLANQKPKEPVKAPAPVSDKPKIVAFGDSLTAGFGLTEKESYPYLLQQKLNADGYNYEVVNAGVSGDTSQGGAERIEWSLEQGNVEILILGLGGNDLLRGLSPAQMKRNLGEIIKKAKEKNVKVLLCGMLAPPTMGEKYQREFMSAFPDLADEHDVAFMPFILEGVALEKRLNQPDGIHPNAEGARVMTENIYKALKPLLDAKK
jgi:acyl-CoA thioesterase I